MGLFEWWANLKEFVNGFGYELRFVDNHPNVPSHLTPPDPLGYHIGAGRSPRKLDHACVFLDGELVHDPHPSRAGIASVDRWYLFLPIKMSQP
jgi:hypothetical protein